MKARPVVIALVFVCLLVAATTAAAQTPVGSGFTYQGQLQNGGVPVNGTCDFQFSLWNSLTGGTRIGNIQTLQATVTNGLFTVTINGAGEFGSDAFAGEARWLEIAVRCPAGAGAYTTLSPRQPITATPYALGLQPGAKINGLNNSGAESFGAATRQMINLWGTQYGIGVQPYDAYFRADNGAGFAWYLGGTHEDIHYDPGFLGIRLMTLDAGNGLAVGGKISGAVNAISPASAVSGANSGSGYGVYGQSNAGSGVLGEGPQSGVVGVSSSGNGVMGGSSSGNGVLGTADAGTGVRGVGRDAGVYGEATSQSNSNTGVYGKSPLGYGVYGRSSGDLALMGAVDGYNDSTCCGSGVVGEVTGGGSGVLGTAPNGTGVRGDGRIGVKGQSSGNGTGVDGVNHDTQGYAIYSDGDFAVAPGYTKSAIVKTQDYGERKLYAVESPGNWFEDFGSGKLLQGKATVTIEPIFAQTVNLKEPYHVFLTPLGDCALYVTDKQAESFAVRALDNQQCDIEFDYRIVAKRLGFEDLRLEPADLPAAKGDGK